MENNLCSQPLLRFCEFGSCPWRNTSLLTTIAEERIVGGLHEILEQHSLTFSTTPVVVFFILSVWNDRIEERKKNTRLKLVLDSYSSLYFGKYSIVRNQSYILFIVALLVFFNVLFSYFHFARWTNLTTCFDVNNVRI